MDPAWVAFFVSFGTTVVGSIVTGSVIYGTMSERVRAQGIELEKKASREELRAAMARLDQIHADLREIRELFLQTLQTLSTRGTP